MKSSRSRAPSPTGTTFSGVSDYSTDSSRSTGTTFSGVSNHRAESYRPLRKSVPPMSQIDYRAVSEVHFNEFDRYLQAYFARSPPGRRSTARQKLTRLTVQQFYELSTDVYDELIRRKNEKEVPFLSARDGFHPKRNEARQKLATLPITRFEDLCGDVHWQLQRRYPEFKEDPSRSKDREPDDREPDDREPEYRAPRDGSSVSSMGDTSNLTAQQQSTTGVPNKSTVEEEDNEIPFGRENGDSRRNIPLHPTVPFIPVNSPGPMPDPVFIQAGRPPVIPIGPQGPFVPMPHPESYQPEAPFIPFIPEERSPIRDDPTLVIQDSSSDSGSERDRERGRERDHRNIPPSPTAPSIPPDLPGPMPQAGRPPVIPIGPQVPFVPMPQPQSYQPEAPFIPFIPSQSPIQALDPNLVIQDSGGGSSGSGSDTERDRERGRERDRRNIPPSPTAPSIPPDLPGPMPQAGRPPVIPIGPQGPFVPIPHPEPYQQDPEGPFISYIPEERSPIQGLDPTLVIQDSGSGSSDSGSERYRERGRERDRRRHEGGRSRSRSGSGRSSSSGSRSSSPPQIIIQQSQPPPVVMAPSSASTAAPAFPDSSSFPNGHGDTGPGTNQSATNDEEPQEMVMLTLKDTNDQYITISLPREDCRLWQTFCEHLMRQKVQALSYVKANQFVIRLEEESKELLFEERWEQWILPFLSNAKIQPCVALCIIQSSCCAKPIENESGFCDECGMQFVKDEPSYLKEEEPSNPMGEPSPLDVLDDASITSSVVETQDPVNESSTSPISPVKNEVISTSFTTFVPSANNSVVRRRKPFAQEEPESEPVLDSEDHPPKPAPMLPIPDIPDLAKQFARNMGDYLFAAYMFMIAPPFVHDAAEWNGERLENRLKSLQSWVWGANAALFAFSAALLAVPGIASSPFPQSFLILSGIFSLFGFVYTIFLAFHLGDRESQFAREFCANVRRYRRRSSWDLIIMISLPFTWMAWAVVSLVCFIFSLGAQLFILDLQSMSNDHTISQSITNATVTDSTPSKPTMITLNILQLAVFMVVIMWSLVYVFMIHHEIRRCGGNQKPRRQATFQLEMGVLERGDLLAPPGD